MRRKTIVLILLTILTMLAVFFSASAQDIDLSGMDNEQLMTLLQTIMDKLQESDTEETVTGPAAGPEPAAAPDPETEPEEAAADPEEFEIYENKKLLREKLPDSYFVKPESRGKDKDKEKNPPTKKDNPPHDPPSRPRPGDRPRPNG